MTVPPVEPWPSGWFLPLAALWLVLTWRLRRPGLLLVGVLLANAWVWAMTILPLARPYGFGVAHDRLNNAAMIAVVAAEGRPLETVQVGQLHFEPLWHGLVALLAGGQVQRVPGLLHFFSLLTPLLFALALYAGLRPSAGGEEGAWERAVVAGFATLLATGPLEFLGPNRAPWPSLFLLKPNHALGLCLLPLVLWAVAAARGTRGRIAAGLALHLLGWVFVLHMAYVVAGLALFALLAWLQKRPTRGREAQDVLVVVGINLLVVSPYLAILVHSYPFMQPLPLHTIPPFSSHLLEGTLGGGGLMLAAAAWGARVLWVRDDRLSRLWLAQALAALALWTGYLLLSVLQLARERDEIFQWLRFLTAVLAGVGAWDLARRAVGGAATEWRELLLLRPAGRQAAPAPCAALTAEPGRGGWGPRTRAVLLCAVLLPFSLPSWWRPEQMDRYFSGSRQPLPAALVAPAEWLARNSRRGDVVAGDQDYAVWAAALTGRRVLLSARFHAPPAYADRLALERGLLHGNEPERTRALAERFGVRFFVVTRRLLSRTGVSLESLMKRPDLELGYWTPRRVRAGDPIAVFRVRAGGGA